MWFGRAGAYGVYDFHEFHHGYYGYNGKKDYIAAVIVAGGRKNVKAT
jgi:hypothetical protein